MMHLSKKRRSKRLYIYRVYEQTKELHPKTLAIAISLMSLSIVILIIGMLSLSQPKKTTYYKNWYYVTHSLPPYVEVAPSISKPTINEVSDYRVSPSLPRYISIPRIGIANTRVLALSTMPDGKIATPANIYDAGWYIKSAKPGLPGVMFVYGHVSYWGVNGIFYNLNRLKSGDMISITRGDNHVFTYRVTSAQDYSADTLDMSQLLASNTAGEQKLILMTCSGWIQPGTLEFTDRLIVNATLVSVSLSFSNNLSNPSPLM